VAHGKRLLPPGSISNKLAAAGSLQSSPVASGAFLSESTRLNAAPGLSSAPAQALRQPDLVIGRVMVMPGAPAPPVPSLPPLASPARPRTAAAPPVSPAAVGSASQPPVSPSPQRRIQRLLEWRAAKDSGQSSGTFLEAEAAATAVEQAAGAPGTPVRFRTMAARSRSRTPSSSVEREVGEADNDANEAQLAQRRSLLAQVSRLSRSHALDGFVLPLSALLGFADHHPYLSCICVMA
jgi:hypothetical protein